MRKADEIDSDWEKVMVKLTQITEKRPKDINAVLFLIGVRELGKGVKSFSKEEKQDLMHIAICRLLSIDGYYKLNGLDDEGWPHWENTKELPHHNLGEQVMLLKQYIIEYFIQEEII